LKRIENSDSWLLRIAALTGLAVLAAGLAAAAGGRFQAFPAVPVAISLAAGGAIIWGVSRRRAGRSTAAVLAFGAGVGGLACVVLFATSLGVAAGVIAPFVVVAAAAFGPTAAFLTADGVVLLFALAMGLSAGGFFGLESGFSAHPGSTLPGLAAVGILLNGVALACRWWLDQGFPEAREEIEQLRRDRLQLSSELDSVQSLATAGRLVAHVAHEVSNPIQAIDNMLFVLLGETPEEDSRRRFLVMMKQGVERITQYLDQLSEFYRPTAGEGSADLNRAVGDVFRFLERQLENSDVKVTQELDLDLPPARISEESLRQVALNIVLNAVEAMSKGGKIIVSTAREGDTLVAAFQDTGPGIAAADLDRIFQPFFTTREGSGGTGLGLSICRRILRAHGGEITAENTPLGARLVVRVPTASSDPK